MRRFVPATGILVLALTACSAGTTGGDAATSTPGATAAPSPATDTTGAPAPSASPTATATYPATPVGAAMAWFVSQMGAAEVEADPTHRFTEEFLTQVPPEQVLVLFGELRPQGPWVTENVTADGNDGVATLVDGRGQRYTLSMQVDEEGKIAGALINSAAKGSPASTWEGVVERAKLGAPEVSVLAGRVGTDGALTPAFELDADTPRPVGSAFKLYVVAAVAEKVAAGELSWDQELTLAAEHKTLPSGDLQNEPDGTKISVRDAATKMIANSDNTASVLLQRTVGEQALLNAADRAGNDHPEGITPFLDPKQMFWLSYGTSDEARAARAEWKDASAERRRELLAAVPMPGPGPESVGGEAQWPNGIEWFISARDLVDAHVHLQRLASTTGGEPLTEILTANSGIQVEGWTETAFKGGSNSGVIAMTFLARAGEGDDAPRHTLITLGRGTEPLDQTTFIAATTDAAGLLAGS